MSLIFLQEFEFYSYSFIIYLIITPILDLPKANTTILNLFMDIRTLMLTTLLLLAQMVKHLPAIWET